jgi:hypothetical protein
MTVCIAGSCDWSSDRKIILCADWLGSSEIGRHDHTLKYQWLPQRWHCLTAGNEDDINNLLPFIRLAFDEAESINETNIKTIIQAGLVARKNEKLNEFTMGKYALPYREYIDIGKTKFPESTFRVDVEEMRRINLGASLIIAGFSGKDDFIIETDRFCGATIVENCTAIGEGAILATAALRQRNFLGVSNFGHSLYCVYEAKRVAERVSSVGPSTYIRVVYEDGSTKMLQRKAMEELDKKFVKYGPKIVPLVIDVPDDWLDTMLA